MLETLSRCIYSMTRVRTAQVSGIIRELRYGECETLRYGECEKANIAETWKIIRVAQHQDKHLCTMIKHGFLHGLTIVYKHQFTNVISTFAMRTCMPICKYLLNISLSIGNGTSTSSYLQLLYPIRRDQLHVIV